MAATLTVSGKTDDVPVGDTVADAARALGYNPSAFLFAVDDMPVPMDSPIEDGWNIKAIKVASGG